MNKSRIATVVVLLGSILGFYIGVITKQSRLWLAIQTFVGIFFGYIIGLALLQKKYGVFLWGLISLIVISLIERIAGSSFVVEGKLEFMTAGLLIGWDFWYFRKQVALLCILGAVSGFVLGMTYRLWFGNIRLEPGIFSAILLAVKVSIITMGYGRLVSEMFGWRPQLSDFES